MLYMVYSYNSHGLMLESTEANDREDADWMASEFARHAQAVRVVIDIALPPKK